MLRKLLLLAVLWLPLGLGAQTRNLPDFADLADQQGPAVVNISTTSSAQAEQALPPGAEEDRSSTSSAVSARPSNATTRRVPSARASSSALTATS